MKQICAHGIKSTSLKILFILQRVTILVYTLYSYSHIVGPLGAILQSNAIVSENFFVQELLVEIEVFDRVQITHFVPPIARINALDEYFFAPKQVIEFVRYTRHVFVADQHLRAKSTGRNNQTRVRECYETITLY